MFSWCPALLLLLLLLLKPSRPFTPAPLADLEPAGTEVIRDSSACSATCGLGLKTQTLCVRKGTPARPGEGDQEVCRVRRVKCLDAWRCGLKTLTVREGARLEIDCLGEVMQAMGPYSWRVSWRYARGVITSDDRLFSRLEVPGLDRVVLEPASEKHAGTYRCEVQDRAHRRGKRADWGVRVLPQGVVNLDYPGTPAPGTQSPDQTQLYFTRLVPNLVLISLVLSAGLAAMILTGLWWFVWRRTNGNVVVCAEEDEREAGAPVEGRHVVEI